MAESIQRMKEHGDVDALLAIVEGDEWWFDTEDGGRPIALRAAWRLSEMGEERVLDVLVRRMQVTAPAYATEDTVWEWIEIAEILAANGVVKAVEPLAAALPLAPARQQLHIADALREIGDPGAIPALIAALQSHHGSYTFTSNDIVVTLKEFGTPNALRAAAAWERPIRQRSALAAKALGVVARLLGRKP
jgi:HEAT repeat protein